MLTSPNTMEAPKRKAIIVLGVHRSGTSALTGLFDLLGVTSAATPIPAHPQNPKGFFESRPIVRANEALLRQAGQLWHHPRMISKTWLEGPDPVAFVETGLDLMRQEFRDQQQIIIKDPRMMRLLPVWIPIVRQAGYDIRVVFTLRHPREVCFSLRNRNKFPPSHGFLLWASDILQAERASRGLRRSFCNYYQLLSTPVDLMTRLGQGLGIDYTKQPADAAEDIYGFVDESLRNHVETEIGIREFFAQLLEILLHWSNTGEDPAQHAQLDILHTKISEIVEHAYAASEQPNYMQIYETLVGLREAAH